MSDKPVVKPKKGNGINAEEHKELIKKASISVIKNKKIERHTSFVYVPIKKGFLMVALEKFNRKTGKRFKLVKRGSKDYTILKKDIEQVKEMLQIV